MFDNPVEVAGGVAIRAVADPPLPRSVSVSVVMPSGHKHTLSHVVDFDTVQRWDCGAARIIVEAGHLVTVEVLSPSTLPGQTT